MARKRGDAAIMQEVESQEEWEDMVSKEGLWVIDVYQDWAGPCNAMVANFRRVKNELGDELLHFAQAKADTIDFLSLYRGRCEPCFLYYAGGVLVGVVHGANAPLILRTLTEQLKAEHAVLDGKAERKRIKDPVIAEIEAMERRRLEEAEMEEEEADHVLRYNDENVNYGDAPEYAQEQKQVTVAIIKPDAVQQDKVDEILEQIRAKGIEVIAHEERHLTEEEAMEFYSHLKDEEYFEDLVAFMTSGPCHVMVLTKGNTGETVVQDWRDLIGPTDVDEAKEIEPESLRARYGTQAWQNALHGSSTNETAAREMAFFFPDLAVPAVTGATPKKKRKAGVQRTLALVRPDAFMSRKDEILEKITEAGFSIALSKEVTLTREQAEDFYKEHKDEPYFNDLINRMTSGPLLALGLARYDAVAGWREMLGPKEVSVAKEQAPDSLRAQFAVDDVINPLHGSDSETKAQEELDFFFPPVQQTVALIKPDAMGTREAIISKIHEAGFKIAARKETVITREIAEQIYADQKDKEYFEDLVNHMTSGPTMFMVLSGENAVRNWRAAIGPTDPEQAKTAAPESLRAQFGTDVLKNAIHGSSNPTHARESIKAVFGDLQFAPDGSVQEMDPSEMPMIQEAEAPPAAEAGETTAGEQEAQPEPEAGETTTGEQEAQPEPEAGETTTGEQDKKSEAGEQEKDEDKTDDQKDEDKKEEEATAADDKKEEEGDKEDDKKEDGKQEDAADDKKADEQKDDDDKKEEEAKAEDDKKDDDKKDDDDKKEDDAKKEDDKEEEKRKTPSPQPEGKSSPEPAGKSSPEPEAKPGSPQGDKAEDKKGGEGEAAPDADKPAEEG